MIWRKSYLKVHNNLLLAINPNPSGRQSAKLGHIGRTACPHKEKSAKNDLVRYKFKYRHN